MPSKVHSFRLSDEFVRRLDKWARQRSAESISRLGFYHKVTRTEALVGLALRGLQAETDEQNEVSPRRSTTGRGRGKPGTQPGPRGEDETRREKGQASERPTDDGAE